MSMLTATQILSMYGEDCSMNSLGVIPVGGLRKKLKKKNETAVSGGAPLQQNSPEETSFISTENDPKTQKAMKIKHLLDNNVSRLGALADTTVSSCKSKDYKSTLDGLKKLAKLSTELVSAVVQ